MKNGLIVFGIALVSMIAYANSQDSKLVNSVLSEKSELYCFIESHDSASKIDPSKVKSYSEGVWYFTNGSAKSCFIKEK